MEQPTTFCQDEELIASELAVVTGGTGSTSGISSTGGTRSQNNTFGFSWPVLGSCDVCGSGIGVLGIAGSGLGPFISAFNTETFNTTTYNMTNNINLNVAVVVPY